MESVLVIGQIRADRRAKLDALLAGACVGTRLFRRGETLALLVDGPHAEDQFLRLLGQPESTLARVVACLEDVPIVSSEVAATTIAS